MVSTLWKASSDGDLQKVVELLVEASAVDIELKDHTGVTPLIEAVRNGHGEVVKALLDKGADPNNASSQGRPEQYTSDPAILEMLHYAQTKEVPNGAPLHESSYAHDGNHDVYGAPPSSSYTYFPSINPAMSAVGDGGAYYQPPGDNQDPSGPGHLPPPEVAKLIPCRYFPICRYGPLCIFAHPPHQAQAQAQAAPYYPGPVHPPAHYSHYDLMGAPTYTPNYYQVSQPFSTPNGVHPMNSMSPPPAPHMMHARSPSEVLSPPQNHFSLNGAPPAVPYGPISPSAYAHPGQMAVPMPLPPPSLHHQNGHLPSISHPPNMYNPVSSSNPSYAVQQDPSGQLPQLSPLVNGGYSEIDGSDKRQAQPDAYGSIHGQREGAGHHRRGSARRGSFGGRKPPCLFFPAGRCKNGDDCRFPHVMADVNGQQHPPYFSGRGGHNGPRPRPHANGNGFPSLEQKFNNMTVRDDNNRQQNGTEGSSRSHSSDPNNRPRYQNGIKQHHAGPNTHGKKPAGGPKQRVPNADDFPVLAGSVTPPSRSPGLNGIIPNGNGNAGPTAAQVLLAPPPVKKDSVKEVNTAITPESVPSPATKETNGEANEAASDVPTVVQEQPVGKLPISFAAVATAAPDVAKEVSVSA